MVNNGRSSAGHFNILHSDVSQKNSIRRKRCIAVAGRFGIIRTISPTMANTEEKYSRPRMIPRQEQSLDRAHHSAEVGSDGNLQGSSLNRSQMRRGYHTDDNYRAPRRRGDPSHG